MYTTDAVYEEASPFDLEHKDVRTLPRIAVAQYYASNDRRETIKLPVAAVARLVEESEWEV